MLTESGVRLATILLDDSEGGEHEGARFGWEKKIGDKSAHNRKRKRTDTVTMQTALKKM